MNRSHQNLIGASRLSTAPMQSLNTASLESISNFKVLPSPTKSPNDKKEYRVIRLANGLTVCLIADLAKCKDFNHLLNEESESEEESSEGEGEDDSMQSDSSVSETVSDAEDGIKPKRNVEDEVKLAAAALCIGVGSFTDPKEIPGLAHFLEHMVFMGSTKFPQENDFDSFIKKRGGSDNAQTEYETTTFYFECLEKHLLQALDKFAQFFISPLMKRESMTREREAVESEFQLVVPSDTHRRDQLLMSLSKKDSPVNKFAWGNLITLKDNVKDDKLYKQLHQFRKQHYSAHRMTLAIQARLPLDLLQNYVLQCFSNVPNNNLAPENFTSFTQNVFDTPEFGKLYYIKPVKDLCQVNMTWMLPSLLHLYKSKPQVYVSWLLGHEGKGSLLSYLKRKVWALSLTAGNEESDSDLNCIFTMFSVSIVLTKEGFDNIEKVIEAVFSYIKLLKTVGPQENTFKEMQLIHDTLFKFQEDEDAVEVVEELAQSMQYYPSEDYLTATELLVDYDPKAISEVIDCLLLPRKVNIMISSTELPPNVILNQTEPWFKTKYAVIDMPEEWLNHWENVECYSELALPEPNRFLTEDFTVLTDTNIPNYPELVIKSPLVELWYKGDEKFKMPNAMYRYYLLTPLPLRSPENSCMNNLLAVLLNIELTEVGYDAQIAELEYSILSDERGIVIKIHGYNQKLPMVLDMIANGIKNLTNTLNDKVFEAVKEKQTKGYFNSLLKPSQLCKDLRLSILQSQYHSLVNKYLAMRNVTFDKMLEYIKEFFNNLYILGLIQGNVSKEIAVNATNHFIDTIKCNRLSEEDLPTILISQIPMGEKCCRVSSFNEASPNSITVNYYQCGPLTIKDSVILEYAMLLIEEPLFDVLRTKEQLGYSVYSTLRDTCGILGFSVTVDSQMDKATTSHVDDRIEAFIKQTQKIFKKLTDKKFDQSRRDLLQLKKCADIDLEEEFIRNWNEIIDRKYMFDRTQQEIKTIECLKIGDVRNWWHNYITNPSSSNYRKLSVQVEGHISKNKEMRDDSTSGDNIVLHFLQSQKEIEKRQKPIDYFILDIVNFKQNLYLYPDQTKQSLKEINSKDK